MYAIIQDSGSQIKVSNGDVIRVALRDLPEGTATITFDQVLLVGGAEGAAAKIGAPTVAGATVTADVISEEKTDKVINVKFKKGNYTRWRGHRQQYLKVKITGING